MHTLVLNLRNGAILATLAATPILVGVMWDILWGRSRGVSLGTYTALLLAWFAATAVVAAVSFNALRDEKKLDWFYPCSQCGSGVAVFSRRCMRCKTHFTPPPEANAFRSALLLGIAVFYATFTLGAFLLNRPI